MQSDETKLWPAGQATTLIQSDSMQLCLILYYMLRCGPVLEVLQYQVNPWQGWSKPQVSRLVPKISLISMPSNGERIRY